MALTKVTPTLVSDQVFGRRRLNINGDMRINQRGTKTNMQNGFGGPDRWTILSNVLGVYTLSQSSGSPNNFAKSFQVTTTTANASPAAGAYAILSHKFEGNDLSSLKWGTADAEQVTVSFWVKTNKTGTYNLELYQLDNTSNPSANKQYTVSSADTWEKKVVTFPAANNVEIPLDNTNALNLNFWLGGGTTYTSGSASDGNFHSTQANRAAGNVNIADSTSNTFRLTGVQLEVGNNATPFEYLSITEESLLCYRYYYQMADQTNPMYGATYNGNTADRGFTTYSLPVPMNHTPTTTQTVGGGSLSSTYHTVERLAFYIALSNGDASAGNVDYFDAEAEL